MLLAGVVVLVSGFALTVRASMRDSARRDTASARTMYQFQARMAGYIIDSADRMPKNKDAQKRASKARDDLDAAERVLMDACRRCASAQECERDRLVIAAGRATDSYNPCD